MTTSLKPGWITTFTGVRFWPMDPKPEDINLADIAHALSMLCRFTGHSNRFYSVAQHGVHVSEVVPPADAKWGLLHDASEAYLLDLARPLKYLPEMAPYREAEHRLQTMIFEKYGLTGPEPESVKVADAVMLRTEQRDLMFSNDWMGEDVLPRRIQSLMPLEAETAFLNRFRELFL